MFEIHIYLIRHGRQLHSERHEFLVSDNDRGPTVNGGNRWNCCWRCRFHRAHYHSCLLLLLLWKAMSQWEGEYNGSVDSHW